MDPRYGERYRELYARHWWWRAREEGILEILRRHSPAGGWGSILDVGCGDGLFFDRLLELGDVEGIEPDASLVQPEGAHRQRIRVAPFDERFRPRRIYRLVLMLDVLEHVADAGGALRHASGMLEAGGMLVATVPAFRLLWTNHDELNHHVTRYRKTTLRPMVAQAGLEIVDEQYWFQWTFPAKLAVRIVERALSLPPKPASIPPAWLNGLLFGVSRLERKIIGPLRPPFGSSLVLVARKPAR